MAFCLDCEDIKPRIGLGNDLEHRLVYGNDNTDIWIFDPRKQFGNIKLIQQLMVLANFAIVFNF